MLLGKTPILAQEVPLPYFAFLFRFLVACQAIFNLGHNVPKVPLGSRGEKEECKEKDLTLKVP